MSGCTTTESGLVIAPVTFVHGFQFKLMVDVHEEQATLYRNLPNNAGLETRVAIRGAKELRAISEAFALAADLLEKAGAA